MEWYEKHSNNWKAIQLLSHGIQFASEHRATTRAGKPVPILRGIAKNNRPSFLLTLV